MEKRFIFPVRLKGNSCEAHLRARASDVQLRLKLPLLQVDKEGLTLYIITSPFELEYPHLPTILSAGDCQTALKKYDLPYIVGHDVLGNAVIEDLAEFPHLLLGGSTNSGKTVGLQALITGMAYAKAPSEVNFILIDVGATDLLTFEKLPHLSYPIVQDRTTAMRVTTALVTEMERRIELGHTDPFRFLTLPRLVAVIDEFPALFMGIDKIERQALVANISGLLQRGRHAKIHVVLAAQNPTFQNMKVDLGNITARIAFKCAKKNFSETILGEGGAENLSGQGDMLLKSPQRSEPQRLQGIYISPTELLLMVKKIVKRYADSPKRFVLNVCDNDLTRSTDSVGENLSCAVVRKGPTKADQQLADTIMWAFKHESISINLLTKECHLGWNTASKLVKRLEELGIVDKPDGKLPRNVIPRCLRDLSEELKQFLRNAGYSSDSLSCAFHSGDKGENSRQEEPHQH